MTGSPLVVLPLSFLLAAAAAETPRVRVLSVSGELLLEQPGRRAAAALPEIALPAVVYAARGVARLDSDLPAELLLAEGDRVELSAGPPDASGRAGLVLRSLGGSYLQVDCGEGSLLLGPGDVLRLESAGPRLVRAAAESGALDGFTPTRLITLGAGDAIVFRVPPRGFQEAPLDLSRITTGRRRVGGSEFVMLRTPLATAPELALDLTLTAGERDLRMAVGGLARPAPRPPEAARAQPGPGEAGAPGQLRRGIIAAAWAVAMMALVAWLAEVVRRGFRS